MISSHRFHLAIGPCLLALVALSGSIFTSPAAAASLSLQNDRVRVGVDLNRGGAITDLGLPGQGTLVNNYDHGRQIQASYYSGPVPFGVPADPSLNGIGWNPIQAGDIHGNAGTILDSRLHDGVIYVKSRPKQWALNNVDCECTFEQWISIEGQVVHVRHRLVNARSDHTDYAARPQELPAVFTIGALSRMFTYSGDAPFTGGPVVERPLVADGTRFSATEHWSAFVGGNGIGVGIVKPDVTWFEAAYNPWNQPVGSGGSPDGQYGWMAPLAVEIIDHDIVYEYGYDLVVGTVPEIRAHAARVARDPRPDYSFATDRQHITYLNATDDGPPRGGLNVDTSQVDPQVIGPEQWWRAETMPVIYVRAAFLRSTTTTAQIFWRRSAEWKGEDGIEFPVIADGQMRTYAVRLDSVPTYRGTLFGLRFDPGNGGEPGSTARVEYVGFKNRTPPPPPAPPAIAPPTQPRARRVALRVRVPRGQRVSAKAGLRVLVRCDVRCRATASARAGARRGAVAVTGKARRVRGGRWRALHIRPRPNELKRMRRALRAHPRRPVRVTVRATAPGRAAALVRRAAIVRR